jgi:acylphosphatase
VKPAHSPDDARLEAVVHGRVQGVGFRYFVQELAESRGIVGWVANEADGTVRCVAEGPRHVLQQLLRDLSDGPFGARVDDVRVTWGVASGTFPRFDIRSGGHRGD